MNEDKEQEKVAEEVQENTPTRETLGSDAGTLKQPDPDAPVAKIAREEREAEEESDDDDSEDEKGSDKK